MDQDLYSRLNYELKLLEGERKRLESQRLHLSDAKNYRLKCYTHKNSSKYYYARKKGAAKYKYVGTENSDLVRKVQEVRHIDAALGRIDQNIRLVTSVLDGYSEYDFGTVDGKLPLAYRSSNHFAATDYRKAGEKWKEEKLKFQACFPENYPEKKIKRTSDGVLVKSISELVIYERFLAAGLYEMYELPLPSSDYASNMYPDFTVLSPIDLKTEIIVEYVGRLDLQGYREDFAKRVHRYMLNGYIPGVNLFFIFGDINGQVDSLQVNKVLADILGIR